MASARSRSFSCDGGEPLGGITQRLVGVELARLLEIGLGLVVVGELHVQHAARDIERRRRRLQPEAVAQDLDADLKRLMGERDVREIEIEVDVPGLQQNRLPQRRDGARRVAGLLVGRGREPERLGVGARPLEQRRERGDGILRLPGHQLHGRQQLALARILGSSATVR